MLLSNSPVQYGITLLSSVTKNIIAETKLIAYMKLFKYIFKCAKHT